MTPNFNEVVRDLYNALPEHRDPWVTFNVKGVGGGYVAWRAAGIPYFFAVFYDTNSGKYTLYTVRESEGLEVIQSAEAESLEAAKTVARMIEREYSLGFTVPTPSHDEEQEEEVSLEEALTAKALSVGLGADIPTKAQTPEPSAPPTTPDVESGDEGEDYVEDPSWRYGEHIPNEQHYGSIPNYDVDLPEEHPKPLEQITGEGVGMILDQTRDEYAPLFGFHEYAEQLGRELARRLAIPDKSVELYQLVMFLDGAIGDLDINDPMFPTHLRQHLIRSISTPNGTMSVHSAGFGVGQLTRVICSTLGYDFDLQDLDAPGQRMDKL